MIQLLGALWYDERAEVFVRPYRDGPQRNPAVRGCLTRAAGDRLATDPSRGAAERFARGAAAREAPRMV